MSAHGNVQTDCVPFGDPAESTGDDRFRYVARFQEYGRFESRLKSFEDSQWNRIARCQLAVAGFFYPGRPDTVQCFYCGLRMEYQWTASNDPWRDHARHVPDHGCDYLNHMKSRVFVRNVKCETTEVAGVISSCVDRAGCGNSGWIPCREMGNCRLCVWECWMTPANDEDSD